MGKLSPTSFMFHPLLLLDILHLRRQKILFDHKAGNFTSSTFGVTRLQTLSVPLFRWKMFHSMASERKSFCFLRQVFNRR